MMKRVFTVVLAVALLGTANVLFADSQDEKIAELKKQLTEKRTKLSAKRSFVNDRKNVTNERLKAKERMRKDLKRYSARQLREVETLYQSRGHKYGSEEKNKNLKKVISKYSRANRAGCAMLYLGQFSSSGRKQEAYLKKAIRSYADCFYGDGVQVGAYAQFWLAVNVYLKTGREREAYALLKKLKRRYPNAISHKGNNLAPQIDAICQQLDARKNNRGKGHQSSRLSGKIYCSGKLSLILTCCVC